MTAIAAVLAFSSTPLLAQEVDTTTPVVDPAPAPAAPAADPLAPDPAPAEAATTEATTTAKESKPKSATAARTTRSATRSTTTRTVTRSAAPAPAPAAEAPTPAPTATAESAVPPVAPGPMPVADPVPVEPAANAAAIDMDEALPIAGGAALGLMLLGGAVAVRRRRRRQQEEADEATKMAFLEAAEHEHEVERAEHPATPIEPAFARAAAPRHDPVPGKTPIADVPTTDLPDEFDLSRFGPHVQAAYRGPTEDNPSLSLKYRLRRASFLDQQERRMAEAAAAKAPEPVPARGNWESRPDADFLFRRAGASEGAKPALQDQ